MRLLLVIVTSATVAHAQPAPSPSSPQALTCPDAAEDCELEVKGKLVSTARDVAAKWDNLRIATTVDGKATIVHASINIPHRTRLKLKAGTRYRFTIAARKPFGARDLWVIDAR